MNTVRRIDFRSLYRAVSCVYLSKKKKKSKFPTGIRHVSHNIAFISHGNPQQYVVLLQTNSYSDAILPLLFVGNDKRRDWKAVEALNGLGLVL